MLRRVILMVCVPALLVSACSKKKPVAQPQPVQQQQPTTNTRDTTQERLAREAQDRMRQDSIQRARDAAAAAEREKAMASLRASLEQVIYFDYNEDKLRDDAALVLTSKVQILRANPSIKMRITGHTDERGSVEYNQTLGMRRAQVTKDYLVDFGIDASRIEIVSMGEDQPQDPGHDESAWSKNRRAVFTITSGTPLTTPGQ